MYKLCVSEINDDLEYVDNLFKLIEWEGYKCCFMKNVIRKKTGMQTWVETPARDVDLRYSTALWVAAFAPSSHNRATYTPKQGARLRAIHCSALLRHSMLSCGFCRTDQSREQ